MKRNKPKYLQLYEELRSGIVQGAWPCGQRLPSRRQIAQERGLSAVTVDHCYELLSQEGYIEARPRSGFYVIYRAADAFATAVLPAAPAESPRRAPAEGGDDRFPFSVLARTMRRVILEYDEALLEKPPNPGCDALRRALSLYLARSRGIHAAPEQIVIGSGAEYLYGMVVEMLGADRIYGLESPSYQKIEQVYRALGVACDLLPLEKDGIRSAALAATAASVLHITPFRSFPSGVTASATRRGEYIRWAAAGDRYIVEDDFESEFSLLRKPEETVFSLSGRENVIYLNTFSRTISPALRAGYMVLPPRLLPLFEARVGFYSCTVPVFEQYLLAELLESGDFERHINRVRRQKRRQAKGGTGR